MSFFRKRTEKMNREMKCRHFKKVVVARDASLLDSRSAETLAVAARNGEYKDSEEMPLSRCVSVRQK